MPFDFGWDWRGSSGYVTDPTYASYAIDEAYPLTFTSVDGLSINAGWTATGFAAAANRSTSVDVRLAGAIITNTFATPTFKVDLTSGSGPGAGTLTVDMAFGDQAAGYTFTTIEVLDNTTSRLGPYSGATSANTYFDASGTVRSPGTSSWDLVRVTQDVSFASGFAIFKFGTTNQVALAHFRLTLAAGGPPPRTTYGFVDNDLRPILWFDDDVLV